MDKKLLTIPLSQFGTSDVLKSGRRGRNIGTINELDEKQFRTALRTCVAAGKDRLSPKLATRPASWFAEALSSYVVEDGRVKAMFLIHKNKFGELEICMLQFIGKVNPQQLLGMLACSYHAAVATCHDSTMVIIPLRTPGETAVLNYVFPDRKE